MSRRRSDEGNNILVYVGIIAVILYAIFYFMNYVGPIISLISIFVLLYGLWQGEDQLAAFGFIGIASGLIFWYIGGVGIGFFEQNPTGINWLAFGSGLMNCTKSAFAVFR